MKILVAPNSFKNSLSSVQITNLLSSGLAKLKNAEIIESPISDGGDGFLEVIKFHKKHNFIEREFQTEFAGEKIAVPAVIDILNKELFLESADIIGLKKILESKKNPLRLNSFALGNIILKILQSNEQVFNNLNKITIGVGGTATIDFGLGALNALGIKFYDLYNNEIIPVPENFLSIYKIIKTQSFNPPILQSFNLPKITCVVDVDTKLLGEKNAIEIYGYQKGATNDDIEVIKKGIENILTKLKKYGYDFNELELNGAGGGLASGLNIFLGAKIIPAKEYIRAEFLKFANSEIPDYVITSEGNFDYQSFEGKATGEIIKNYSSKAKKIFVICGLAEDKIDKKLPDNIEIIQLRNYFNSVDESITNASLGIKIASEKILNQLSDISSNLAFLINIFT